MFRSALITTPPPLYKKYTGKIINIIVCAVTYYSFCVLNFMSPTCRLNFAHVSRTRYKVERAWYRDRIGNQLQCDPLSTAEERVIPGNTGLVYVQKTLHTTIDRLLASYTLQESRLYACSDVSKKLSAFIFRTINLVSVRVFIKYVIIT